VISLGHRDGGQEELLDELVQAHLDTIEMSLELHDDPSWMSHVAYLQGLVRHAKRTTAARMRHADRW
jgi:hypothetical protein